MELQNYVSKEEVLSLKNNKDMLKSASYLYEQDPSQSKKYVGWMLKQLIAGSNEMDILPTVTWFHSNVQRFKKRDIQQYKTLAELEDDVKTLAAKKTSKATRAEIKEGADKIAETDRFLVYHLKTKTASAHYGLGTRWCITMQENNYYESYVVSGHTFCFLIDKKSNKDNNKFYKIAIDFHNGRTDLWGPEDVIVAKKDIVKHYIDCYGQEIGDSVSELLTKADTYCRENPSPYYSMVNGEMSLEDFEAWANSVDGRNKDIRSQIAKKCDIKYLMTLYNDEHEADSVEIVKRLEPAIKENFDRVKYAAIINSKHAEVRLALSYIVPFESIIEQPKIEAKLAKSQVGIKTVDEHVVPHLPITIMVMRLRNLKMECDLLSSLITQFENKDEKRSKEVYDELVEYKASNMPNFNYDSVNSQISNKKFDTAYIKEVLAERKEIWDALNTKEQMNELVDATIESGTEFRCAVMPLCPPERFEEFAYAYGTEYDVHVRNNIAKTIIIDKLASHKHIIERYVADGEMPDYNYIQETFEKDSPEHKYAMEKYKLHGIDYWERRLQIFVNRVLENWDYHMAPDSPAPPRQPDEEGWNGDDDEEVVTQ